MRFTYSGVFRCVIPNKVIKISWVIPNKIIKIEVTIFRNIRCITGYLFKANASNRSPRDELHYFGSTFEAKISEPIW